MLSFLVPSTKSPFPYYFSSDIDWGLPKAKSRSLVILGDKLGLHLDNYEKPLRLKLEPELVTLPIINLSAKKQGLHRNIKKLKNLKTKPEMVFYSGATEEFLERKFDLSSYDNIQKNFEFFKKPLTKTVLEIMPWLSKIVYSSVKKVKLTKNIYTEPKADSAKDQQMILELKYKLFEVELEELIEYCFDNNIELVLSTAPINLENLPIQVCQNSTTNQLDRKMTIIAKQLLEGDYKSPLKELKELEGKVFGNSRFYYLLGRSYYLFGDFKKSRHYFELANSFDCYPKKSSHILNNIIRAKASKHELKIIDFDQLTNIHFGKNITFFDEDFPQEIYYDQFLTRLSKFINHKFK